MDCFIFFCTKPIACILNFRNLITLTRLLDNKSKLLARKANFEGKLKFMIKFCDLNKKIENYRNFFLNMQYKIQLGFAVKSHNLDTLTLEGPQTKVGLKNPLGTYGIKKFGLSSKNQLKSYDVKVSEELIANIIKNLKHKNRSILNYNHKNIIKFMWPPK
ncbi:hypothetical protein BpHYR1_023015 [Brachionus plicatilis]|uniref:Uncharacterized protein n=1 Tax=Brachionus plicatilis TaxID=10195 RepID=A0A3M7QFM0_BRAPC|nr:hypothetical protein BpHYR1_023015 [Brachionus plicatilis]